MLFHVGEPSEAVSFLRPLLDFVETNGLPAYSVSFSGISIFDNMDFPALQRINPRPMETTGRFPMPIIKPRRARRAALWDLCLRGSGELGKASSSRA